ncbi:MAG: DNA polymerase IV [Acidimicrobiia bacterium]|nr:DNA polymerase IV [Acidimicrobiia bacterium]
MEDTAPSAAGRHGSKTAGPINERAGATILHADLDAFYVSAVLLDRPELVGKPVAVGGGVIVSASYEARAYGVDAPMGIRQARELCPRLIVVSGAFEKYIDLSDKVFEICERYTPFVEQVSIDEAFLDVGGAEHLFGSAEEIAADIRSDVKRETGLPISVGVARTKFLAKVASQAAKPDGLLVVHPDKELEFLHPLPVRAIWGVGAKTAAKLRDMGIETVADLADTPKESLRGRLGPHAGSHLLALAWNLDRRAIQRHRRAGSVGAQRAFGGDVRNRDEHRTVLWHIADRVGSRLRSKDRAGRTITAKMRFADMQVITRATTLRAPVASTEALYRTADLLVGTALDEVADGRGLSLLGISVSKLVISPHLQLELPLDDPRRLRSDVESVVRGGSMASLARDRLDVAVDELREKFGKGAVANASTLVDGRRLVPDEFGDLAIPVSERKPRA